MATSGNCRTCHARPAVRSRAWNSSAGRCLQTPPTRCACESGNSSSQIKLTAGGGVSSPFSPLDVSTFTEAELRAAVEAAENWGTYVVAHAFTPAAIQRALAAGVKCIEHGFLMDEATAKLIAETGVWLSVQPLPEEMRLGLPEGSVQREKADE